MTTEIKTTFEYKGKEYLVKKPGSTENRLAQTEYSRVFAEAVQNKALLKKKLQQYMIEQKIWDESKTDRFFKLAGIISEAEIALTSGGISLDKAVEIAKQTKIDRAELQEMIAERSSIESSTAEGQAENARFQKLLTVCLVYKDNDVPVFNSVSALLDEQDEDKLDIASKGFDILGQIIYKLDDKFEANLVENKFLREWNLMDDKLRFLKDGKLVDSMDRLIDENGRLINDKGQLIDGKGNLIDDEGQYIPKEVKPFLDKDGNPLTPPRKL